MGSYLLTCFFCNFSGKEDYLISLRSVHIRILCLRLKYAFLVNSKHYSRSNGTKGNFKPWNYLLLNSALQALLSLPCFSEGVAGLQLNHKKCTSSRIGVKNVFSVILPRQHSGNIGIRLEDIKSQQANNSNFSLNHVIEPCTFDEPQNSS